MKNRIQALREEHHMTQIRLSIALGVSQETVSAYEHGRHYPSVAMLIRMSELFHASCDYILGISSVRLPDSTRIMNDTEQQLIAQYRSLPNGKREKLLAYLDGLSN